MRGITSSVDIVWSTDSKEVKRVSNVSGVVVGNSLVYSSIYNNSESAQDNKTYECSVRIDGFLVANATDTFVCKQLLLCSIPWHVCSVIYPVIKQDM